MSKNYSNSTLIKSLQIYKHFLIWQIFFLFFVKKVSNRYRIATRLYGLYTYYTQNRTQKYGSLGA